MLHLKRSFAPAWQPGPARALRVLGGVLLAVAMVVLMIFAY